ncbi:hypothetical protein ACE6H2_022872 [Prunus campanulata]
MEGENRDWEDDLHIDEMAIHFGDSLDLQERIENKIALVGLLIAENETPQSIVKDILRVVWSNMGNVKVCRAKENVYSIKVEEEEVQAHRLPRNLCTMKNARQLGERIGYVLEVEDTAEAGFRGFLRIRVNIDATKPLPLGFILPCAITGRRKIRLAYEGLKEFCFKCGRLGHVRGCRWQPNPRMAAEDGVFDRNHWRFQLERDGEGLYDKDAQGRLLKDDKPLGNTSTNKTNPEPSTMLPPLSGSVLQTVTTIPGTDTARMSPRLPNCVDYARLWDPESFGTHLKNGTLTLAGGRSSRGRTQGGISRTRGAYKSQKGYRGIVIKDANLCDVEISPTRELVKA